MSREIEIIPDVRILARMPGEVKWSPFQDFEDRELQRALIECEIAAYKILMRHFSETHDNREKYEERP